MVLIHLRRAVISKILNLFNLYFLKWMIYCCSKQIYKSCLIYFWRKIYQWYFFMFLFIERYGSIHILEVVARKSHVKDKVYFSLLNPSSILKRKNVGLTIEIVIISQQMYKFRKISNVHICILISSIFIFSVKSIKLTSIIHNWSVYECNIWKNWPNTTSNWGWNGQTKKAVYIFWRVWNEK